MKFFRSLLLLVALGVVGILGLFWVNQRRLLYFPSHDGQSDRSIAAGLSAWYIGSEYTGYVRAVDHPRRVWLFLHGNGGEAANREFMLRRFSPNDTVYILEYPGFGERTGSISAVAINECVAKAYGWITARYPGDKIIVMGESLGSGPAALTATLPHPPRHIVLMVPFDVLSSVAQEKYPFLPVRLILSDNWDNVAALAHYSGELDIFAGKVDAVIPPEHARRLASQVTGARLHEFDGGHGWANSPIDLSAIE